jgi:acyl-CoA synthetase (AMP-forming)/AMP-acid ligase II
VSGTLGEFLAERAERFAGREAVVLDDQRWTYRRLFDESTRYARALRASGVSRGTRVGLLMPNDPRWLAAAFGIWRAGGTLVALNTFYHEREMAHALRLGEVELLLAVGRFLKRDYAALLAAIEPRPRRLVLADSPALPPGAQPWDDWLAAGASPTATEPTVTPDDDATIFFTSGSTAESKGVLHAHGALVHQAEVIAEVFGLTPDDRAWAHLPLFFSGGCVLVTLPALAVGAAVVLQNGPSPQSALALLERERCTVMAGWHQARPLLEAPGFDRRRICLKKGVAGNVAEAVPLLGEDHLAVGAYGMTETATFVCANYASEPAAVRRGSHGRPLPGVELRIVHRETGSPVAAGSAGEILLRGPSLMRRYLGMTPAECFDREGFFHTGDEGVLLPGGRLDWRGRLKDVIKTAGVNVASAEVEAVLATHPAIHTVHVVGVPHVTRGENVAAFVVPRDGETIDPEGLATWARERLASYKVPRHVFVVARGDVPTTGTGKVAKAKLRAEAVRRLDPLGDSS